MQFQRRVHGCSEVIIISYQSSPPSSCSTITHPPVLNHEIFQCLTIKEEQLAFKIAFEDNGSSCLVITTMNSTTVTLKLITEFPLWNICPLLIRTCSFSCTPHLTREWSIVMKFAGLFWHFDLITTFPTAFTDRVRVHTQA